MAKICYTPKRFQAKAVNLIETCNGIIEEYERQGFDLTLRQLYYQCVARDYIPNTVKSYKNLGDIINDARLAGLVDWERIEDRTRFLRSLPSWKDPEAIVRSAAYSFRFHKWDKQKVLPEIWIEKDALVGVIEGVCNRLEVPFFSCRGYVSQSEMWRAAQRFSERVAAYDQRTLVLHFGDHDPSGIDMSRDIEDRIRLFMGHDSSDDYFDIKRIALNRDQVNRYNPPENPAKLADPRAARYIRQHGPVSWELDALEPSVIANLITEEVERVRDAKLWKQEVDREKISRKQLTAISTQYAAVCDFLAGHDDV